MKNIEDLWEAAGDIDEQDAKHVLINPDFSSVLAVSHSKFLSVNKCGLDCLPLMKQCWLKMRTVKRL